MIFASRSARVFAMNPANGQALWTFRTRTQVNSSPVVAGNTVYVGSDEGMLYAVDVATGRKLWQFRAGREILSSVAIAQGRLVFGNSDGWVWCLGK
ncbi:MAG: PQQ-binding-like beta-propeller repeat protein [Opitutales bacterium]|nr:PQQ-binding-like beta-propeller repeat protein [Opitutales bacterium]